MSGVADLSTKAEISRSTVRPWASTLKKIPASPASGCWWWLLSRAVCRLSAGVQQLSGLTCCSKGCHSYLSHPVQSHGAAKAGSFYGHSVLSIIKNSVFCMNTWITAIKFFNQVWLWISDLYFYPDLCNQMNKISFSSEVNSQRFQRSSTSSFSEQENL